MECQDVTALIDEIRYLGSELDDVEAKTAHGGLPQRIYRSLSALSNRRGGGVILLGVDEAQQFAVVGVPDVAGLQADLSSVASEMRPPLRLTFDVCQIEGETVVAVTVPECPANQKPCYWERAGLEGGAYVRVGNTNRRMTQNEIRRLWLSQRGDVEPTWSRRLPWRTWTGGEWRPTAPPCSSDGPSQSLPGSRWRTCCWG